MIPLQDNAQWPTWAKVIGVRNPSQTPETAKCYLTIITLIELGGCEKDIHASAK